jgi:hypothetical protein
MLVQYKENQNVSRSTPIWLNMAYSIGWSGAETKTHVFQMTANFRDKRTSITTMRARNRAFAIFPTRLIPHYPLPLRLNYDQEFSLLLTQDDNCAGFCDLSVLRCDPKFHICLIAHSFIHTKGGQC